MSESIIIKETLIKVRYNTKAINDKKIWTIMADDMVFYVDAIVLHGSFSGSKNYLGPEIGSKYHISGKGALEINIDSSNDFSMAIITTTISSTCELKKDTIISSLIKSISYRIFSTFISMLIAYVFTGSVQISMTIGLIDFIVKLIIYFAHERLWILKRRS